MPVENAEYDANEQPNYACTNHDTYVSGNKRKQPTSDQPDSQAYRREPQEVSHLVLSPFSKVNSAHHAMN
jgi:hypothetical protein